MKKLLIVMTAVFMLFAFTACGGGGEPAGGEKDQPKTEEKAQEKQGKYLEILKSAKYYMEYEAAMTMDGQKTDVSAKCAIDGDDLYVETKGESISSKMLIKDGSMYVIDDGAKQIIKMEASLEGLEDAVIEAGENTEFIEKGVGQVNGEKLEYEKYKTEGETVYFYLDDGKLKYIVSGSGENEVVMKIHVFTDQLPPGIMELPKDYTEIGI